MRSGPARWESTRGPAARSESDRRLSPSLVFAVVDDVHFVLPGSARMTRVGAIRIGDVAPVDRRARQTSVLTCPRPLPRESRPTEESSGRGDEIQDGVRNQLRNRCPELARSPQGAARRAMPADVGIHRHDPGRRIAAIEPVPRHPPVRTGVESAADLSSQEPFNGLNLHHCCHWSYRLRTHLPATTKFRESDSSVWLVVAWPRGFPQRPPSCGATVSSFTPHRARPDLLVEHGVRHNDSGRDLRPR